MIGVGLASPVSAAVFKAAREAGYLVNNAVPDRVRLIPPLVLTEAQAAEFLERAARRPRRRHGLGSRGRLDVSVRHLFATTISRPPSRPRSSTSRTR